MLIFPIIPASLPCNIMANIRACGDWLAGQSHLQSAGLDNGGDSSPRRGTKLLLGKKTDQTRVALGGVH